jgi:hypothetical protein
MTARKIILIMALLRRATSITLAQSTRSTGTIARSESAGYGWPNEYGDGLYNYAASHGRHNGRLR